MGMNAERRDPFFSGKENSRAVHMGFSSAQFLHQFPSFFHYIALLIYHSSLSTKQSPNLRIGMSGRWCMSLATCPVRQLPVVGFTLPSQRLPISVRGLYTAQISRSRKGRYYRLLFHLCSILPPIPSCLLF